MTNDRGILIKNIFYMLSYAFQELKKSNYRKIAVEDFDDIHDLFAEILACGVAAQLKQGLHRTYIPSSANLTMLRGKLNMPDTIKLFSRGVKQLACEYDEYSEDNVFNQILKTTMTLLAKHRGVKPERRLSLRRLLPFFTNVRTIEMRSIRWSSLQYDRNSKRYQMLMYICNFIMDNVLLTTEEGSINMHTFTDELMCRLFERFLLEYYKKHHSNYQPCARKVPWNVVEEESSMHLLPTMQTDVFLTLGERTLIIDAKYYSRNLQSRFGKQTIHSHNQYQILNYVLNHDRERTGKTDGMLLYAKTEDTFQPYGHMKWREGNMIYYRHLDLNQDFDSIKSQLDNLLESLHK